MFLVSSNTHYYEGIKKSVHYIYPVKEISLGMFLKGLYSQKILKRSLSYILTQPQESLN